MPNPFCHIELNTTNLPAAKAFYSKLFDWQLEEVPGTSYTFIKVGNGTGGGMMTHPSPAHLPHGSPTTCRSTTSAPPPPKPNPSRHTQPSCQGITDVMGHGQMSVLIDPTGAAIALWQPAQKTA